jgi:hypothetical protein
MERFLQPAQGAGQVAGAARVPAPKGAARARFARQRLRIHAVPVAVRLAVVAIAVWLAFPLLRSTVPGAAPHPLAESLRLLLLVAVPALLLPAWWQQRRHSRLIARPEYEVALNQKAIAWLCGRDFERVRLEGEIARETVYLPGWRPRWLLVTNRRLLLFTGGARERQLLSEWPRRSIVHAGCPADLPPQLRRAPWLQALMRTPNLALAFTTGTVLQLHSASGITALRVAQLLMSSPALPDETTVVPAFRDERTPRRWHEVLASCLLPGAGQCLQGRFTAGAVLFTLTLLLFVQAWAPLVLALRLAPGEWPVLGIAWALGASLLLVLVAGSDAWHFSATRLRR